MTYEVQHLITWGEALHIYFGYRLYVYIFYLIRLINYLDIYNNSYMKKMKLLTALSSLPILGMVSLPLTSCGNKGDNSPVKPDEQGKSKETKDGKASYSLIFNKKPDDSKADVALTNQSETDKVQFITETNDTTSTTVTVGDDLKANVVVGFVTTPTQAVEAKFNLTFTYKVDGKDVKAEIKDCVLKFVPKAKYTITVTATEHGSVDKTSIEVVEGTTWNEAQEQITPTAEKGYDFMGWQKDGQWLPDTYVINSNITVQAVFEEHTPIVIIVSTTGSSPEVKFNNLPDLVTEGDTIEATYSFDNAQMELKENQCDILVGTKSVKEFCQYKNGTIKIDGKLVTDHVTIKIVVDYKAGHLNQSWDQIIEACNTFEASDHGEEATATFLASFSAKDKTIKTLADLAGCWTSVLINNKAHIVRIIGSDHDKIADKTYNAALTFELVTLLSDSNGNGLTCQWDTTNNYDYTNSILRWNLNGNGSGTQPEGVWSNSAFSMLPSKLKADGAIKTVNKKVATYNSEESKYEVKTEGYDDKLFALTYSEIGQTHSEQSVWLVEGSPYEYWQHNPDFVKLDFNNNQKYYFLNTPKTDENDYAGYVNTQGVAGPGFGNVKSARGISFAFCI